METKISWLFFTAHGVVKYVFCLLFLLKSDKVTDYTVTDLVLRLLTATVTKAARAAVK